MKIYGKKFLSTALALGMVFSMKSTVFAASDAKYTKNENVYVRLEQDGKVNTAYVVNTFHVTTEGEITDYGDYDKVQNLTNLETIESDKEEHTFTAKKGKFYYQGNIEKAELPWSFDIVYTLDGNEVEKEELAGQEGELKIFLKVRRNPSFVDKSFFQSYLLQISFTLDPEFCDNIQVKGTVPGQAEEEEGKTVQTSVTDAGGNEVVMFTVSPDTEADLEIAADIENFEMDDISINAAAAKEFSKSYVSEDNTEMEQTSFMISAEGVSIPETVSKEETQEEMGLFDKLLDLFKSLSNG